MPELRSNPARPPPEAPRSTPQAAPALHRKLIRSNSFADYLGGASRRAAAPSMGGLLGLNPSHDSPPRHAHAEKPQPDGAAGAGSACDLGEIAPNEHELKRHTEPDAELSESQDQHSAEAFADPLCRGLARPAVEAPAPPRGLMQLDPRLAEMIQRVAWGRQGTSSTLRLELGGKLRGAVLLLSGHDRGGVSVSLELPQGEDAAEWRERIARRLGRRGLSLDALEVA